MVLRNPTDPILSNAQASIPDKEPHFYGGDEVEANWTEAMKHFIGNKLAKFPSYARANEKWLMVYDNWNSISLNLKDGTSRVQDWLITLSSQRPADISPTIVSQIHNFFIHRLVNERDLMLLDNTISTLDSSSKALIPTLAKGCCVVTGTAFDLPMILKIDPLLKVHRPSSDDVNLEELWALPDDDL